MKRRLFWTLAIAFLVNACASGPPPPPPEPPAPPPLDPTGTYDIVVYAEGMEVGGTMIIRASANGGYSGDIDTDMGGAAIANIAIDGQTMTFTIPEAGMSAEVEFEGDEFNGSMSGGMGDASITGVKRTGS